MAAGLLEVGFDRLAELRVVRCPGNAGKRFDQLVSAL